ncbi:hypothetical protein JQC72_06540 [Polycladomyces sp. WAk]|uniref:Uncharacterized protein n=1 Tax=Polycladomyces zharkentensis TaxID=2807616 RepID=A0ABS2WIE7_9BACL|nr:hypothetical protein [Polycladomyces sp. WAk]MBN2909179.1 hypothetical protein [Polycladomyces sp. WAk]
MKKLWVLLFTVVLLAGCTPLRLRNQIHRMISPRVMSHQLMTLWTGIPFI